MLTLMTCAVALAIVWQSLFHFFARISTLVLQGIQFSGAILHVDRFAT